MDFDSVCDGTDGRQARSEGPRSSRMVSLGLGGGGVQHTTSATSI